MKNDDNEKPFFIEPMANITTRVGQIAKFQCLIGNLKDHKVSVFNCFSNQNAITFQLLIKLLPFVDFFTIYSFNLSNHDI